MSLAAQRYGQVSASTAAFSASVSKASISNDNLVRSTGLARHELINLGRQAQDVATQFAMGATPMQVFASQAAQIGDIFASTSGSIGGFIRQVGGGFARFATSGLGLASAGAGAGVWGAFAASNFADGQREIERALHGVGAASGVTLAAINRLAEGQATAAKVSIASAREIVAAYAGTGKVNPTQLPGLLDFTRQFGAMQGLGNADAAAELAKAFADPTKGAEALADRLGGLNSAAQRWIAQQQAAGNMLGAQTSLLEAFRLQVEGSTDRLGFFARAWDSVKRSVSDADDALGRFLAGSATAQQQLETLRAQRDRFATLPIRTQGAQSHLAGLDAEIRKLEAIVELDRQRAAIDERVTKAANASRAATGISDRIDTYTNSLRELQADATKLQEALRLNPRAGEADEWTKALQRVQGAMSTLLPTAERERLSHDLTMRAIMARTLAERTAIEVARETLRLSGEKVSATEREAAALRKAQEIQAQANRDAQDALRASRDQLALAGLRPGERFRVEQEQARRDNIERFGSASGLPAASRATTGMEATFAATLKRMMDDIPGLSITSGFRTYEQQARLYAEKPGWAAKPGTSNHERGIAADIAYKGSGQLPSWLREKIAAEYGVSFPLANRARNPEPWHVEPNGGRSRSASTGTGNGAADEIYRNAFTGRERDLNQTVIGAAEEDLKRQTKALELQQAAFGKSTAEVVAQNKAQELFNQLIRAGGDDLAGKFAPEIQRLAAGYGELARAAEQAQIMNNVLRETQDIGAEAFKGIISDLRAGKSGAEAFANALNRVADKLLDTLVDGLFGRGTIGNVFGGGGGLFGAFTKGFGLGFSDGGYTGSGGKYDVAGFVHRDEFVFSKEAVRRLGPENLDRLHRGALKGYDGGGYVTPAAAYSTIPAPFIHQPAPANANRPQTIAVSIDVRGATGNAEIQKMVAAGVSAGMAQVQKQIGKDVVGIVSRTDQRMHG